MDAHAFDPVEFKKHLKGYWVVFGCLCIGTLLTVGAATFGLHQGWSELTVIIVAVIIASAKASLVALYFMHLIDEKKLIYWTLVLVAVLFMPLMFLPNFTQGEANQNVDLSKHLPMPGLEEHHAE